MEEVEESGGRREETWEGGQSIGLPKYKWLSIRQRKIIGPIEGRSTKNSSSSSIRSCRETAVAGGWEEGRRLQWRVTCLLGRARPGEMCCAHGHVTRFKLVTVLSHPS